MADRYFVESPISGSRVVLSGPEAHHLIHVMRAKRGTAVVLFDGSGAEFAAEVRQVGRREVALAVLRRDEVDRELPLEVTLAVAMPKGDRQRWLVEKAVELGVSRVVPLRTARSVAEPGKHAVDRLRRIVIEASKQCGRNRLMQVAQPRHWPDFVAETSDVPLRLLAHPTGRDGLADLLRQAGEPDRVLAAVGPEGGFTEEEVSLAMTAGWRSIDLGPRILRVETAAILLAGILGWKRGQNYLLREK